MAHRTIAALVIVLIAGFAARAIDQPLPGTRLRLARSANRENLALVLNDPAIAVPAAGSADDPAQYAGLGLTLFGHGSPEDMATWSVAAGAGWKTRSGARTVYRYRNPDAPAGPTTIRAIVLRQGRGIKIAAKATGL